MNVLLNASTVKYGGGLSTILNFLHAFKRPASWEKVILIAPDIAQYKDLKNSGFHFIPVSELLLKKALRFYLLNFWIGSIIKKEEIDFVFSLGNLPLRTKKKQALLFDNPFATLDNFKNLKLSKTDIVIHKLRQRMFFCRIKYLDLIFPQTEVQQHKLEGLFPELLIRIIPNSYPLITSEKVCQPLISANTEISLLVFSKYYRHKNFEILLSLGKIIHENKSTYRIYLTLNETDKRAKRLLKKIEKAGLQSILINLGEIPPCNIEDFYKQFDGVLLSTLMESFSMLYAEALKFKKIIFTSDRDFAHDALGDNAIYFDPFDANSIYKAINSYFSDNEVHDVYSDRLQKNNMHLPDWYTIAQRFISEINKISQ